MSSETTTTTDNASGYDFAYLKDTVGNTLTQALAQLALQQPEDPVDFVGNFLLKHVSNVRREAEVAQYKAKKIEYDNQKSIAAREEIAAAELAETQKQDAEASDVALEASLKSEPTSLDALCTKFLSKTLDAVPSSASVYIGRRVTDASSESDKVHWFASAGTNASVILNQSCDAESGVTFDAFVESTEDDAAVDEEGNPVPPSVPSYCYIPNVIREPRMKFYGVPKIGEFLYKAISYNSSFEDKSSVSLVVACDSMGKSNSNSTSKFSSDQIQEFIKWSNVFKESVSALEERLVAADAPITESLKSDTDGIKEAVSEITASESSEEEKLKGLSSILLSKSVLIQSLSKVNAPFSPSILNAITSAVCLIYNKTKEEFINPVSKTIDWNVLRNTVGQPDFCVKVAGVDAASVTNVETLSSSDDDNNLLEELPIVGLLQKWTESVLAANASILAAAEAEAAQAEEAENEEA